MTTMEMNAEIYRYMGDIATDEAALRKAWKYLKGLAAKMHEAEDDPTLMSKDEYMSKIDRALAQAERGEGRVFNDVKSMNAWLNTL